MTPLRTAPSLRAASSSTQLEGIGCFEFGVGDDDEFSHDCGDGDEGFLAG
jgi:hypothetical protein